MKNKKNKSITFYPADENIIDFAPQPIPASKNMPEWYKRQPPTISKDLLSKGIATSTIKKCMPIFDAMTAGYLLLAPCDIYVDATNPDNLEFSAPNQLGPIRGRVFSSHSLEQYGTYPIDTDKYHRTLLRVFPLWAVGTPPGYSCMVLQPMHTDESPIVAFPGIVDTDSFVTDGHFSFLVEKNFKGTIKRGTPLVQLVPFQRESWEMEITSPEESKKTILKQGLLLRSVFANGYKNFFRAKKEYN
jgi:hypothetical protein